MTELSIRQAAARLRMRRAALAALCAAELLEHTRYPHQRGRPILIPIKEIERLEKLRQGVRVHARSAGASESKGLDLQGNSRGVSIEAAATREGPEVFGVPDPPRGPRTPHGVLRRGHHNANGPGGK